MPHPHRTTAKSLWEVRPTQQINVELKTITMNKIKSFASVAIIALVTTVLTVFNSACSKDEGMITDIKMAEKEMLVFKDYEEYSSALNKVLSFDEDELKLWEEQQGFKSFGRICDEMYENVKQKDFTTIEGLMEFVNSHNTFLKLEKMETGDYVLEVALEKHLNRYLLNRNKMYAIGENAYKVFEEGVATTSLSNKEILINATTLKDVDEHVSIKYSGSKENHDITVKNIAGPGTFLATKWEEVGVDAVKIRISLDYSWQNHSGLPITYLHNYINVRGYRKFLVWMYDTVSISGSFKVKGTHLGEPYLFNKIFEKKYCKEQIMWIFEGPVYEMGYIHFIPNQTILAYDMWGKNHRGQVVAERAFNPHLLE